MLLCIFFSVGGPSPGTSIIELGRHLRKFSPGSHMRFMSDKPLRGGFTRGQYFRTTACSCPVGTRTGSVCSSFARAWFYCATILPSCNVVTDSKRRRGVKCIDIRRIQSTGSVLISLQPLGKMTNRSITKDLSLTSNTREVRTHKQLLSIYRMPLINSPTFCCQCLVQPIKTSAPGLKAESFFFFCGFQYLLLSTMEIVKQLNIRFFINSGKYHRNL